MRIAVIDDSEVARAWVEQILTPLGHEVVAYGESLGIQAFVRRTAPDVLLLDVNMPALNGDTVCKMLKQNAKTSHVVVALYSGLPEEELGRLAADAGADGYVRKTDEARDFVDQITRLVNSMKR